MAHAQWEDFTGKHFGHLTAIKRVDDVITPKGYHTEMWLFDCDCGRQATIAKTAVRAGQDNCGRQHAYPEPDKKPKTPAHVVPLWMKKVGDWQYEARPQTAPTDKKHLQGATFYLSRHRTIKEAQQAIQDYYKEHDWHPGTQKASIEKMQKVAEETHVAGTNTLLFKNQNAHPSSQTGVKGVGYRYGQYYAYITVAHKTHYKYGLDTIELAKAERKRLEERYIPKINSREAQKEIPAAPKTPKNISATWRKRTGAYRFRAVSQPGPKDTRKNTVALGTFDSVKEAQQAIKKYEKEYGRPENRKKSDQLKFETVSTGVVKWPLKKGRSSYSATFHQKYLGRFASQSAAENAVQMARDKWGYNTQSVRVSKDRTGFAIWVRVDGKQQYLGHYKTSEGAIAARDKYERKHKPS